MNNALIIMPHNPGDVVMALPVVTALNYHYPKIKIDFVVSDECAELVQGNPLIHKTHIIPRSTLKSEFQSGNITGVFQLAVQFIDNIRQKNYDLSLNLFQDKYGAMLHGFIKASLKLGFHFSRKNGFQVLGKYMRHLFAIPVNRSQNPWHVVDIYLKAFDLDASIRFNPEFGTLPRVIPQLLPENPGAFFVFQLGSAWEGKRWPLINWAKLTDRFLSNGIKIVFIGHGSEGELFHNLKLHMAQPELLEKHAVNLIGRTSLLETRSLLMLAKGLITPDTVAMHLAADLPCKVFALFGGSNPIETGPYGPNNFIFQKNIEISEVLPLASSNKNLSAILPEDISDFILNGIYPKHILVWTTYWDVHHKMEMLVNFNFNPHPFQSGIQKEPYLLGTIPRESFSPQIKNTLEKLSRQIALCLQNNTMENLEKIYQDDFLLEEQTRNDIFWEAFRIKCNSLPIYPLEDYLRGRLRLLEPISKIFRRT